MAKADKSSGSADTVVAQAAEASAEQVVAQQEAATTAPVVEAKPESILEKIEDFVIAVIPRSFLLRLTHEDVVQMNAGTQKLPRAHAEHWYSRLHGVKIVD